MTRRRFKLTREEVAATLGNDAMVDAAGVIANFQRMVRIADSTGIPLDEPVLIMTQQLRNDLGINEFSGAEHNPDLTLRQRIMGKLLAPLMPLMLKRMANKRKQGKQNEQGEAPVG